MSISKGAFGQSAKGAFIESPMGARGWGGGGCVVLSGSGTDDRWLASLNPKTGAEIWGVSAGGTSGTATNFIGFNSAFQLFCLRRGAVANGAGIYRRSMTDGAVDATLATSSTNGIAAIGSDVVFSTSDTTLGSVQRRSTAAIDGTYLWTYDAPNINQTALCATGSDGTSYYLRLNVTVPTAVDEVHRWAIDSSGNILWTHFAGTGAAADVEQFVSVCEIDSTYIYAVSSSFNTTTFISTYRVFRFLRSDGSFYDDVTTAYNGGLLGSVGVRTIRLANNSFYCPLPRTTPAKSVSRVGLDMAEIATFDLGIGVFSIDSLPSDSVGAGDIIVIGGTTTAWPGSGGSRANCWRISSDLSTIRWGVQIGPDTYNGIQGISSLRYKHT